MSEQSRLDRHNWFHNTFYTKCINAIIESIGPSIILRSIYWQRKPIFTSLIDRIFESVMIVQSPVTI